MRAKMTEHRVQAANPIYSEETNGRITKTAASDEFENAVKDIFIMHLGWKIRPRQ